MDWTNLLRNCKHCGLGISHNDFHKINFFCDPCWAKLEKYKTQNHFVIYKTPQVLVRPLYLWNQKESIVKDLIHGLKGGTPFGVLDFLSKELSSRYILDTHCVIVPVPSSKVGEKDHAFIMAKIISEHQKQELWHGLKWQNKSTKQKFLNKTERFVSAMKIDTKIPSAKRVILIDDLVTTGATATAAYKAFKGLNQIEVWSLACRL